MRKISRVLLAVMTAAMVCAAPAFCEEESYTPGLNMDDAAEIPLYEKVYGSTGDSNMFWFSFTTDEAGTYRISAVDKTLNGRRLVIDLVDDWGETLASLEAGNNGGIGSLEAELDENQVYYVAVYTYDRASDAVDYVFVVEDVSDPSAENTFQLDTADFSWMEEGTLGHNVDDAKALPFDEKINASTGDSALNWYVFETGSDPETEYGIRAINRTAGGRRLYLRVCDESGNTVDSTVAGNDGKPAGLKLVLEPETIYYVSTCTYDRDLGVVDYSLQIQGDGAAETNHSSSAGSREETAEESPEDTLFD